jgi:hypothetical protein
MEKPIKPKKPQKAKIHSPNKESLIYYEIFQACGELLLFNKQVSDDERDEMDAYPPSHINLGELCRACAKHNLDINQTTLQVSESYDDSTIYLTYTHKYSEKEQREQEAQYLFQKQTSDKEYQEAMAAYPQALEDYQTKKAEYDVWMAQQKLASLKKS